MFPEKTSRSPAPIFIFILLFILAACLSTTLQLNTFIIYPVLFILTSWQLFLCIILCWHEYNFDLMLTDKSVPLMDFQMYFFPETSLSDSQEVTGVIDFLSVKFSHWPRQDFRILDNYHLSNKNIHNIYMPFTAYFHILTLFYLSNNTDSDVLLLLVAYESKRIQGQRGWVAVFQSQLMKGRKDIIVQSNSYHHRWTVTPAPIK